MNTCHNYSILVHKINKTINHNQKYLKNGVNLSYKDMLINMKQYWKINKIIKKYNIC